MFHVPEKYRVTTHPILNTTFMDGNNGYFDLDSTEPGWRLAIIASDGESWEHVSVHCYNKSKQRTPSWKEMCFIKDLFWDDEDIVIQYHPKKSDYINLHKHTLHLWRNNKHEFISPPKHFVG